MSVAARRHSLLYGQTEDTRLGAILGLITFRGIRFDPPFDLARSEAASDRLPGRGATLSPARPGTCPNGPGEGDGRTATRDRAVAADELASHVACKVASGPRVP